MVEIKENYLIVRYEAENFARKIKKKIEWNGIEIFVVFDENPEKDDDNVFAIKDDNILWRIENLFLFRPEFAQTESETQRVYTTISIYPDNENLLIVTNFNGHRFLVNPENGAIVGQSSWVK
ncbi:MAG: hypothetical protein R3Y07_07695 [Eubacteriales bacterium]